MPPPFMRLSAEDFDALVSSFEWKRTVNAVHVHHTWRPRRSDYRGEKTIKAMYDVHTGTNGWTDIAQHVTVAPDGLIWTGRNWNQPPASAKGFNGTRQAGPFMLEMIGDFNTGQDSLDNPQREAALHVVARLLIHFRLATEAVRFHNEMSSKTCPGGSIVPMEFLAEVKRVRARLEAEAASGLDGGGRRGADGPFPAYRQSVERAREHLSGKLPERDDPEDAELPHGPDGGAASRGPAVLSPPGGRPRDAGFGAEQLAALRPHVVNSRGGVFSPEGLFRSSAGTVDAIFDAHLQRALDKWALDRSPSGQPFRILFYAHGGLVDEAAGLQIAADQIGWWRANGVYPIHFVWETGLSETIGQLLSPARDLQAGRRDIFDHTSDRAIEELARRLGGLHIWSGMKAAARRGIEPGGAAAYVVQKLEQFCKRNHKVDIELHAVGHSAGSIFHSYFVPTAAVATDKPFATLSLLAPAITVEGFRDRLEPGLGGAIKRTAIFTMAEDWERADNTAGVYRKSLLYLIHNALERERQTPILGLEESLRKDPDLRAEFGLGADRSHVGGEVVFSKTAATTGPDASTSTTHGGFDNDAPTMEAVLRRVVDRPQGALDAAFPKAARGTRSFPPAFGADALPPELKERLDAVDGAGAAFASNGHANGYANGHANGSTGHFGPNGAAAPAAAAAGAGRRRALCIGINAYPSAPLYGCVADAEAWSEAFVKLGFAQPAVLTDAQATRDRIIERIGALLRASRAGDVVAIHFSGHGTQLEDVDNDEGDSRDEAICPYDFESGAFIIDDDFAEIFADIPDGVGVTCFFDCCHSGTNTRLAVGVPTSRPGAARPRFLHATPEMQASHKSFRAAARRGARGGLDPRRHPDMMRQVVFSACMDREVAYEQDLKGDFTRHALQILSRGGGGGGLTNERFQEAVVAAFGKHARQHPLLDCAAAARQAPLLGSVDGSSRRAEEGRRGPDSPPPLAAFAGNGDAAKLFEAMAALLRGAG